MIGYAGLSHLGVVSSIAAASMGFDVVAYDSRADVCEQLAAGSLPVLESGLQPLLDASRDRIRFTSGAADLGRCDLVYLSVDVSTDADNRADLTRLRELIALVVPVLRPDATLIVLSQIPPGFTRRLSDELPRAGGRRRELFCQVETLIFGRAVERALRPERFIVGCDDPSAALPAAYAAFLGAFKCPVLRMAYASAELAKASINVFLAASVSATNMLAEICEAVGADWGEIAPALRLDQRIGPHAYLAPGLGLSGGNIERDLATIRMLAAEFGTDDHVVSGFISNSEYRRDWVLRALHQHVLSRIAQPRIAVWGLAYKPNTHSVKNSPTLVLLEAIAGIPVQLYDPQATLGAGYSAVTQHATALDACRGADALVLMTGWEEFAAVPLEAVKSALNERIVIDAAAIWRDRDLASNGFTYATLGRSTASGRVA